MAYRYNNEDEDYYEEELDYVDVRVMDKLQKKIVTHKKRNGKNKKNNDETFVY